MQGGGAALPSRAEAARAGEADLALVLGTSGEAGRGALQGERGLAARKARGGIRARGGAPWLL